MPKLFAITETYRDVAKMIYKTSWRMSMLYHVPFEDVLGQAHILFMQTYLEFDPYVAECRFSTWLQNVLYWRLTDWCKYEYRERRHADITEAASIPVVHRHCWLHDLMASVGDEAKVVIQAVISSPKELKRMMARHHIDEGEAMPAEGVKAIREVLQRYLHRLGWMPEEVRKGFREIRNVLAHGVPDDPKPKRVHRKCKLTKPQVRLLIKKYG